MRFAAVASDDEVRWSACAVRDELRDGVPAVDRDFISSLFGPALATGVPIVIEKLGRAQHICRCCNGKVQKCCEIESCISVPIVMPNGARFGNLCAIDTEVKAVANPQTVSIINQCAALIARHLEDDSMRRAEHLALMDERAAGELREQFVAILGHDLRNPLQAVLACGDVLRRKTQDPEILSLVARIKTSGQRMSALIEDVLDFTRIRLGDGIDCQLQDVDNIENGLNSVVKELQEAQPRRTISADISVAKPVRCDIGRLQQLVSNLLSNALSHGSKDTPVCFAASENGENLILRVWNDGDPIPPEIIGKIFAPFWRHSDGSGHQGLGLGLHICSEIVRAHRGTITVTSDSEHGTVFTVTLPLGAAQRPGLAMVDECAERLVG
jgi:signal transduction histidine kinase